MRFWDASAVVPLLVTEAASASLDRVIKADPGMMVWWGTEVECASALARLEREGALDDRSLTAAIGQLAALAGDWHVIDASDRVREAAIRFLRVHPLRAADALQLAAAFVAADRRPLSLEIVTLDDRLAAAARREGFPIADL